MNHIVVITIYNAAVICTSSIIVILKYNNTILFRLGIKIIKSKCHKIKYSHSYLRITVRRYFFIRLIKYVLIM